MGSFGRLTDAPARFVIGGGRLIDPGRGTDSAGDLVIVDGRIAEADAGAGLPRLDATGMVVAPGFVDLHAHLREPGAEWAETIESGTRAAARGGFTAVCAMPNAEPPTDDAARVAWQQGRATGAACAVHVVGAATAGRGGERLADLAALAQAGAVAFSDDGASLPDVRLARAAMLAAHAAGRPLIEHAEDTALAGAGVMRAGAVATRLGLDPWPASAEVGVVERDIALAAETGARLHLTHLSTTEALDAVRRARERGVPVSCDVTPHHLALTDAWVAGARRFAWEEPFDAWSEPLDASAAYDAACRVNPPLPTRADALALLAGVADGTVDAIATDHAPHPAERKLVPFAEAAPGIIGLETALSLALAAVDAGAITLAAALGALSTRPAAVIGLERSLAVGQAADVVVFDPRATWRVEAATLASRSSNTPLLGMELPGVVALTVAGGRVTWDAGLLERMERPE